MGSETVIAISSKCLILLLRKKLNLLISGLLDLLFSLLYYLFFFFNCQWSRSLTPAKEFRFSNLRAGAGSQVATLAKHVWLVPWKVPLDLPSKTACNTQVKNPWGLPCNTTILTEPTHQICCVYLVSQS